MGQPGVGEGVPAYGRGLVLDGLYCPFQPKPFSHFMISTILSFICLNPKVKVLWDLEILVKSESTDVVCPQAKGRVVPVKIVLEHQV